MSLEGLAVIGGLLVWAVFDIWAWKTGRATITDALRRWDRRYPWFRYLVLGLVVLGWVHLFGWRLLRP